MHSAFVTLNNVPSRIVTYGKWIEESFDDLQVKEIIVLITGNPGITAFYSKFIETLHNQTQLPVWCIGHAGHEQPPVGSLQKLPSQSKNQQLYNMQGQIQHKVDFFAKYIPKDVKVHLIGHSLGAYIITELLKRPEINQQIGSCYLMFPTLDHIGNSPNGKFYTTFVRPIVPLIVFLSFIFTLFPLFLQKLLVHLVYMSFGRVDSMHLDTICSLVHPRVLNNIFFMATDEMRCLKERNDEAIRDNLHKIHVFYGQYDGWNVAGSFDELKSKFPTIRGEVSCAYAHAFVLKSSTEVGNMVSNWIRS